jgi:hypothetical protein
MSNQASTEAMRLALSKLQRFSITMDGEDYERADGDWVRFADVEAALATQSMPAPVQEPVAWMTHHDDPMLFSTEQEAAQFCDDAENPIPLYAQPLRDAAPEQARWVSFENEVANVLHRWDINEQYSVASAVRDLLAALPSGSKDVKP